MDITKCLTTLATLPGLSGYEQAVAEEVKQLFLPYADEVTIDPMFNVIAHKKGTGPKVMLAAHMDEIGLMVTKIEKDGTLRIGNVGGVDPRILPGMRVKVFGKQPLLGVVGAKPPHLLTLADRKKNYPREELFVDVAMSYEKVKEQIQIGDLIAFHTPLTTLKNNQVSCKTMDDRACVVLMLQAAKRLMTLRPTADIYFVATTQEEVGSRGAKAAAFDIAPDLAIALDVTHATIPASRPDTTCDLGSLAVTVGPYVQPKLVERMKKTAKNHGITLQTEVATSYTGTDGDDIQISREGVPMMLLSLPLKYMHTTVETIDTNVLVEGGRLLAHFLAELDEDWGKDLWI
ncbi:MAG: M42 family metallopeptidase [Clostridiales bacterium]|nr:M42 family metallopeptidase [Clostridiales bacterium]